MKPSAWIKINLSFATWNIYKLLRGSKKYHFIDFLELWKTVVAKWHQYGSNKSQFGNRKGVSRFMAPLFSAKALPLLLLPLLLSHSPTLPSIFPHHAYLKLSTGCFYTELVQIRCIKGSYTTMYKVFPFHFLHKTWVTHPVFCLFSTLSPIKTSLL